MCMLMALCKLPRYDCWSSSNFFTHPILFKVYCRHRINNLYKTRRGKISICYTNYHVAISGVVATFLPI